MTKARELRQEYRKLYEQQNALVKENPDGFDDETQAEVDARFDAMSELRKKFEGIEKRQEAMAEAAEILEKRQETLDDDRDFGEKRYSAEEAREKRNGVWRDMIAGRLTDREFEQEMRTLQGQTAGTAAQGGNTFNDDFLAEVQVHMKAFGGMRSVARVINTANGRNLDIPTSDDTSNVAKLVAEATAPSTTTRVPFGQVTLEAHKYQSGPIKFSLEIEQDSAIDIEGFVAEMMGTRFARVTNTHFTTRSSTESTGPHGIVNYSTGAVAVANNALKYANVLSLLHSVDPSYRQSPSAAFMTNDAGFQELRNLRSSTGTDNILVWQPSLVPGQPDTLLGYPIVLNQDVPLEGTTGNKWLWFGDWSRYAIRDVMGMSITRLDERYAEEGNSALLGFMRTDGRSILPSTTAARRPFRALIHSS